MTLIVSRAVRTLIKKHAWQKPLRYSYGFLLGTRQTLFAALPVGDVARWSELDIEWLDNEIWPRAFRLAAITNLSLVGTYVSMPELDTSDDYGPLCGTGINAIHEMTCCQAHSWTMFQTHTKGKADYPSVVISSGASLLPSVNQRRIVRQWNDLLGRKSYKDEPKFDANQPRRSVA